MAATIRGVHASNRVNASGSPALCEVDATKWLLME
jgi:hypothetical protein